MKKNILLKTLLLALLCMLGFNTFAEEDGEFYFGYSQMPIEVSDLEDVHMSDWERWGTGSLESRVALSLSEGNRRLAAGINFGFKSRKNIPFLCEFQIFLEESLVGNLLLGFKLHLLNTDIFKLSISPKVGGSLFYKSLGTIETFNGFSWVDVDDTSGLSNEDPRVGDQIYAQMVGGVGQITADMQINFNKTIGLVFSAGISEASYGDLQLVVDRDGVPVYFDTDDAAIVVADENSVESANLDPEITASGQYFSTSLVINF